MVRNLSNSLQLHCLTSGVGLFLFWLVLSGQYNFLHIFLGIFSSVMVVWVALYLQILDRESHPIHLGLRVFPFWLWLSGKVIQASFNVVITICRELRCSGGSIIIPVEDSLEVHQKSHLGIATYANSITLTPGTLTLGIEKNIIKVHSLTRDAMNELKCGEMDRRVARFEGPY